MEVSAVLMIIGIVISIAWLVFFLYLLIGRLLCRYWCVTKEDYDFKLYLSIWPVFFVVDEVAGAIWRVIIWLNRWLTPWGLANRLVKTDTGRR